MTVLSAWAGLYSKEEDKINGEDLRHAANSSQISQLKQISAPNQDQQSCPAEPSLDQSIP